MTSRRDFMRGAGAITAAVGAAAVSKAAMAALPEPVIQTKPDTQPPYRPTGVTGAGRPYNPVVTLERLDAAVPDERGRQGVPSGRRTRGARDGARHEGAPVGLQRPVAGPDHRGGRRRPRAPVRHQSPARAHQHPLARAATAERHGRRRRAEPADHSPGQDLRLRVRRAPARHLHVPPARGRDDADGDGDDGHVGHAPEGTPCADRRRRPRLLLPAECASTSIPAATRRRS